MPQITSDIVHTVKLRVADGTDPEFVDAVHMVAMRTLKHFAIEGTTGVDNTAEVAEAFKAVSAIAPPNSPQRRCASFGLISLTTADVMEARFQAEGIVS
jgi:hypothetical protein